MSRQVLFILSLILFVSFSACGPISPVSPTPLASALPLETVDWDNREIFRAGLIKSEQPVLEQLTGASRYQIELQIADDFTSLQGRERVRYTNQEAVPLEAIYFRLFPNLEGGKSRVAAVSVDGQAAVTANEADNSSIRVSLAKPLPPGGQVVIQMDFSVEVPTRSGGNYGLFGYLDQVLVLDGFYPAIPVYDEHGWHAGPLSPNADTTFQDASFYIVQVTAPASLKLVASGVEVARTASGSRRVTTFAAGPARDFYLAASEQLTVVSAQLGETQVNSYAFANRTEGAQLALRTAVAALKSYGARLGSYPYTEFEVVSTPLEALGIEYPGLTGINLELYDLQSEVNGLPAAATLEATVAHEVGHQWFYNLIGNDQTNEPWLDEALTQYLTGLYFQDVQGAAGFDGYRGSWLSRWKRVGSRTIAIGLPASAYQGREYGAIVYGRGPLFVEALAKKMGQPTFDRFLGEYTQKYAWGLSTTSQFKTLAEQNCRCDLTPLFDEWVNPKP